VTEELYEEALTHAPDCVSVYDLDGTFIYMNPATERAMGATLDTLRGRCLFEVYPTVVGTEFHAAFQRAAAAGPAQTFRFYSAPLDAWFVNRVVRVGDRVHVYARDITEDTRRQRRLDALSAIAQVITGTELDERATAHGVVQVISNVIDAQCSIAMLSDDRTRVDLLARAGRDLEAVAAMASLTQWRADVGDVAEALRTRTTVLRAGEAVTGAHDTEHESVRAAVRSYQPTSVIVAPLTIGDVPLGILSASRRSGTAPLKEHDRILLAEVAPSIALYLANARRRAEANTLRSRLTALTDSLPALAAFIDKDERYVYVNAAYGRWFGRPPESYVGTYLRDMMGPAGYPVVEPHVRTVLSGTQTHFRARISYPNGARDIDAHYVPIRGADGSVEGFAVLVHDISAEVRVEEEQRSRLEAERQATSRLESLLALTGQLAAARTPDEIVQKLVDRSVDALGSNNTTLWQLSDDGTTAQLVRERGLGPHDSAPIRSMPMTAANPIIDCLRTGRPVWIASRAEYAARYPEIEKRLRSDLQLPLAFAVLPSTVGDRQMCLAFTFHDETRLSPDARTYLEILASHGAEALRRARADRELHDVNEMQSAMIQSSPGAIVLVDTDGTVRTWNGSAERIFGWKAEERIGRHVPVDGDELAEFRDNMQKIFHGSEVFRQEARRRRANGDWFDVEIYAAPVRLANGETMAMTMLFDISERKRVERGRQLINDASGRFNRSLDWNETIAEVVKLPIGVMADLCVVDLLAEDGSLERIALTSNVDGSTAGLPRRISHASRHSGASGAIEARAPVLLRDIDEAAMRRLARDDEHFEAIKSLGMRSSLSVPLMFGDRLLGALSIGSRTRNFDDLDVSILTELAARAATAMENARLYEDARKARSDAEGANRSKDEFLAMLGHELRNPLAPLVTALDLMQLRGIPQFERERAIMQRQVSHLSRLVDDLLDVSRITRGKVELRRERLSLADILAKAVEQTSPLFDERRHYLTVDVPPELAVEGDATRLAQIVANLLSNAAKYTPADGRIGVTAKRVGADIELAVRDNGIGIEAAMLPQVFDLFVQAPQSSERPAGGLGLGLTIVRSLVELHGGRVSVHSEGPGQGSEFVIVLPAADSVAVVPRDLRAHLGRSIAPRRILVVDDNEDAALMLADLLDAHGHEIRTAFDGPSALRIADEFRPEIAVLDIGLPFMDGYELAQRLRASPSTQGVRLIALTGYGQDSDRARSLDAGFQAHLAKPVAIETLVKLVEHS
jgi:PAS domain S-box-containing protein